MQEELGKDEKEEADDVNKKDAKQTGLPEETRVKLEGMGFIEKEDKPALYVKSIDDVTFFWDFRKVKNGSAYASRLVDDEYKNIPRNELEAMEEYTFFRPEKKNVKKPLVVNVKTPDAKTRVMVPASDKKAVGLLRGSERDVIRLMDHGIQLDSIIAASENKKKLGEGLLWHELKFGNRIHVEPSAELVDLIAQDMGNVSVKIVEFDTNTLEDPNSMKKYLTYYCVAEATDGITNTSGLGAAEQIIDFDQIKSQGRTFARTLAIRKASRNAVERLIPIPRKAMVYLIRKKLEEHNKKGNM